MGAFALAAACPAAAQVTHRLEASPALRCLVPAEAERGAPDYPFVEFKDRKPGRVMVELAFEAADAAPRVRVLEHEGGQPFLDAVKAHVAAWRVPCLSAGAAPARLRFFFVFKPDERRGYTSAGEDAADAWRHTLLGCVRHVDDESSPAYPSQALRANVQGRVLARLRYVAPDRPPEATFFARRSARDLSRAAQDWTDGLRMPCHTGEPVEVMTTFLFKFEGDAYGFGPGLGLRQLLGMMRPQDRRALPPDTTAMGCPFDVRLQYRQPDLPNRVEQVGDHHPARRPVLAWLRDIHFELPAPQLDSIYGDTATLEIPCLKINPDPKQGVNP